MDRRIKRTKKEIKFAILKLLQEKEYESISIQDIIDTADIGRATFYTYFKSKDEIITAMSNDIFHHISSQTMEKEVSHDFSSMHDFSHVLEHLLCHLMEEKETLKVILNSGCKNIFLSNLKENVHSLTFQYFEANKRESDMPDELVYVLLNSSLIELIFWWIQSNDCSISPKSMIEYFYTINHPLLKAE